MDRRSIGMALLAGGTLLSEVALTRVLSISLFHHLAFLVVSTAMLGTAAAGVAITVSRRIAEMKTESVAAAGSLGFALLLPIGFSVAQLLGVEPLRIAGDFTELVKLGLLYVLLAIPYFCSGLAIAALLDRFAKQAPHLYAADLIGAGIGSFLALLMLSLLGSRGALITGAVFGALAAVVFGRVRSGAAAALGLLILSLFADAVLPLHITRAKVTRKGEPFAEVLRDPHRTKSTEETSFGRVDLVDFGPGGKRLMIDAGVAAVRVPPPGFRALSSDATLPYELRPQARVLIIGAGAGWEVVEALRFGAGHVDAVEVNPAIQRHMPEKVRNDPKVNAVVDEGRSFLQRQLLPYDAIVMIHTISNAATSAGALHLAEDYLLTQEAIEAALGRLGERGFLFITRPEAQLPRLLTTIVAALGPDRAPARHLAAWTEQARRGKSFYAGVLVSPSPLAQQDLDTIQRRLAERSRLKVAAMPGRRPADALIHAILARRPLSDLESLAGARMDPPTDDRPFFHQRRSFLDLRTSDLRAVFSAQSRARMALEDQPVAELSALLLLIETSLIGFVLLLLPLILKPRSRGRITGRRLAVVLGYFAAIGIAFMLTEIALIQRLGLLLGRPATAFATVFAGLLVGAGIGSKLSTYFPKKRAAALLAVGAAIILAFLVPPAVKPFLGLIEPFRVIVGLMVVVPSGVALGMPFPLGLVDASMGGGGRLVPWAFAANGIASIAGTVLALILAAEIGFSGVLLLAAGLYAVAFILYPQLARQ